MQIQNNKSVNKPATCVANQAIKSNQLCLTWVVFQHKNRFVMFLRCFSIIMCRKICQLLWNVIVNNDPGLDPIFTVKMGFIFLNKPVFNYLPRCTYHLLYCDLVFIFDHKKHRNLWKCIKCFKIIHSASPSFENWFC